VPLPVAVQMPRWLTSEAGMVQNCSGCLAQCKHVVLIVWINMWVCIFALSCSLLMPTHVGTVCWC